MWQVDRQVLPLAQHISADTNRRLLRAANAVHLRCISLVEKSAAAALFCGVGDDGRAAAVKVLTNPDGDPDIRRRAVVLRREARYLAASGSPYTPRLVAVDDEGVWLAREFIEGQTLEAGCESIDAVKRLGVLAWVSVMVQDLFARFHDRAAGAHVIRDLKPRNIILDQSYSRAVLVDLGGVAPGGAAARAQDGKIRLGTGKWRFWAPEQLTNAERVGREADYFAYASIAFFILTGRPVLRNLHSDVARASREFARDCDNAVSELRALRSAKLTEECIDFLAACLQVDPSARPRRFHLASCMPESLPMIRRTSN